MPASNAQGLMYYFYAPTGRFLPCGMFTRNHLIAVTICFILTFALLFFAQRKRFVAKNKRNSLIFAILLTALEAIKISHSFIYGETHLDAWFPLSYCGLFLFALWMLVLGSGKVKRAAEAFIAYGCPVAGLLFMIFPTTSLMSFPIWHYFSLYSLFFHSLMLFYGINTLLNESKLCRITYMHYLCFVLIFSIPAITMNLIFDCNLMNFHEPYNIPISLLHSIHKTFPPAYIALVMTIYMLIPIITEGTKEIIKKTNNKYKNKRR